MSGEPGAEAPQGPAHLRVVRGGADELELAALVAGLVAASTALGDHQPQHVTDHAGGATTPAWLDRGRTVRGRVAPRPGPDAWRWSLRD